MCNYSVFLCLQSYNINRKISLHLKHTMNIQTFSYIFLSSYNQKCYANFILIMQTKRKGIENTIKSAIYEDKVPSNIQDMKMNL
jgi:hypothetical protein